MLLAAKPRRYSVVQYLAKAALELQRAWLQSKGLPAEPMLLCINSNKKEGKANSRLWVRERMLAVVNEGTKDQHAIEVPVVCQGLNKWQRYDTAAFMATTKMQPEQKKFLSKLIPEYSADLDRTVDQCIQFMFRCSLRNSSSKEECFIAVSDRRLAEQVNGVLTEKASPATLIAPQVLLKKWKPSSVLVSRKEDAEVVRVRNAAYQATPEYKRKRSDYDKKLASSTYRKEYLRLSNKINIRTKKLIAESKNRALAAEIEALKLERSNLKKD
jgi:hypothetical protein